MGDKGEIGFELSDKFSKQESGIILSDVFIYDIAHCLPR